MLSPLLQLEAITDAYEKVTGITLLLEAVCNEENMEQSYRVYIRDFAKYSHFIKLISKPGQSSKNL